MSTMDLLNDLHEELPLKDRPLYLPHSMKWLVISAIVVSLFWVICNTLYSHYYLGASRARHFTGTLMVMAIAKQLCKSDSLSDYQLTTVV
jgi:hypothetical protein